MRHVPGTQALAIRFDLLERAPGMPTVDVRGGELGVWVRPSDPTLGSMPGDVWRLSEPVAGLDAPARYRFRVGFRWIGAAGRVIAEAVRYSAGCSQPPSQPLPVVRSITASSLPGRPGSDLYAVVIENLGEFATGPLQVVFDPGGATASTARTIAALRPHRSRRLWFTGPVCSAASPPSVSVFAGSGARAPAVATLVAACPQPVAGAATLDSVRR